MSALIGYNFNDEEDENTMSEEKEKEYEPNLPLKIKEPIDRSYANEDDVPEIKKGLHKLGHYEIPSYGLSPLTDENMFTGIKKLQKAHNLSVDGRIEPAGETINKMNDLLSKKSGLNQITDSNSTISENYVNWRKEIDRVAKLKGISDENKHQYISCLAGQGGLGMASLGLAGGVYKEITDLNKKINNPKYVDAYGGNVNIIRDSFKDMKNNLIGLKYGFFDDNPDCFGLLSKKK